jgi:polyferredoxin
MLSGIVVLGFMYNKVLTMIFINKILLGYWPQWQTNLYWYLLVVGILLFLILENYHFYCERICPFGAAQECIGAIGGAKRELPKKVRGVLRWVQRGLSLGLILVALVYSNPAVYNFEISGAFFNLIGSTFLFALLGVMLISALFLKRPWCRYLCPIRPVADYIRLGRNWIFQPKRSRKTP